MIDTSDLLTYWIFQADPHIKESQDSVFKILVEMALHEAEKPLLAKEIVTYISNLIQQPIMLSEKIIQTSVDKGIEEGKVKFTSGNRLSLTSDREKEFNQQIYKYTIDRNIFREGLVFAIEERLVEEKLSPEQKEIIIEGVENQMLSIFHAHRFSIAERNGKEIDEELKAKIFQNETPKIEESLDEILGEGEHFKKEQIRAGIIAYFRQLPNASKRYITTLYYRIFIHQILNLDPSIQRLQRDWFKARKLYLDTNILISLLCPTHPTHDIVEEIINATLSLEVQIHISPATLKELSRQLKEADEYYYKLFEKPDLKKLVNNINDDIVKSYFFKKLKRPRLAWSAYISMFEDIETLIFNKFNILVEAEAYKDANDHTARKPVEEIIRKFKGAFTHQSIIKHDALNFLLVNILREKYPADEMGSKVWFITLDSVLTDCQVCLKDKFELPCLLIQKWGSNLLPYESIENFIYRDFITYLVQSRIGAIAHEEFINIDFLARIKDADLDIKELLALPSEHATRAMIKMQKDREVRNLVSEAMEAKDEKRKSIDGKWLEELKKAIFDSEEASKEKELLTKRNLRLMKKLKELEKKEESSREESEKVKEELKVEKSKSIWEILKEKLFGKK